MAVLYLGQYSTYPSVTCFRVDNKLLPKLRVTVGPVSYRVPPSMTRKRICFRGPLERPFFFCQSAQRLDYIGESLDELPIVGVQSQEAPQLVFARR
jgi:hypothetical protein